MKEQIEAGGEFMQYGDTGIRVEIRRLSGGLVRVRHVPPSLPEPGPWYSERYPLQVLVDLGWVAEPAQAGSAAPSPSGSDLNGGTK